MNALRPALCTLLCLVLAACTAVQPGADPIVVNAERTIESARVTLDSFVRFEFNHRSRLPAAVTDTAEKIRKHAPEWFARALRLKQAYKLNRSQANEANLLTAIALLQQTSAEAATLLAAHR